MEMNNSIIIIVYCLHIVFIFKSGVNEVVVGKCRFWDIDLGNFKKMGQFFLY